VGSSSPRFDVVVEPCSEWDAPSPLEMGRLDDPRPPMTANDEVQAVLLCASPALDEDAMPVAFFRLFFSGQTRDYNNHVYGVS